MGVLGFVTRFGGGEFRVNWEMMKSSLSWVSQSLACISTRACSRAMSLLVSMVSSGTLVGDAVLGLTKEEPLAGRYTEKSRGKPKVYLFQLWISPQLRDPFLMLGQLWFGLSPETSRGS